MGYIKIRCIAYIHTKLKCVYCSMCWVSIWWVLWDLVFQLACAVIEPEPQWPRLRCPGCWRWKKLCWTPWRTRFWRWMALRVTWCRSAQVRAFWMQVNCATSTKALGWATEPVIARLAVLLLWSVGSGSNTLETQASMWILRVSIHQFRLMWSEMELE